jgi:hypothetical protein
LDQQDTINEINSEVRVVVNGRVVTSSLIRTRFSQEDAEAVLKGDDDTARGVNVPEGMKLEDVGLLVRSSCTSRCQSSLVLIIASQRSIVSLVSTIVCVVHSSRRTPPIKLSTHIRRMLIFVLMNALILSRTSSVSYAQHSYAVHDVLGEG